MGAEVIVIPVAQMILQAYFALMAQQGKTAEEAEALYQQERAAFYANKPEDLPDPA
jgi:hypothetical protein